MLRCASPAFVRGELEREWLLNRYDELQRRRVRQHMRFAEFWYAANGIFEDIQGGAEEQIDTNS